MDAVQGIARENFRTRSKAVLVPIGDAAWADLQRLLDRSDSADPNQRSAAYFAMTGRYGAWLVQDNHAAVIVCRHPNIEGEFLAFPPIGEGGPELLAKIMAAVAKNRRFRIVGTRPS